LGVLLVVLVDEPAGDDEGGDEAQVGVAVDGLAVGAAA